MIGYVPFNPTRGLTADLRLAARRLLATPLFTIFAVVSLAIGVGVTTAAYSVVDSIFLKDLGIRDPERLAFIVTPYDGRWLQGSVSQPDFQDLRAAQTSFSSVSAFASFQPAVASASTTELVLAGPFVFIRDAGLAVLALGVMTLLLAMAGLFGIQSHIVSHRTREIGVRLSLGASAGQIKRMVLKDGYRPVLEGLALGLFIGFAGRAIVRAYLDIETALVDPWILLVVPVPLIVSAFFACYLPARSAAAVDPNVALRHL